MSELILKIYDYDKYIDLLSNYKCNLTYYPEGGLEKTQGSAKFYSDLLVLSNNRCYMCGQTLEAYSNIGVIFEREHLINKTINGEINPILLKCKKNIVPICRSCNGKKNRANFDTRLIGKLEKLKNDCKKDENNCSFCNCLNNFKNLNFDFNVVSKNYKGEEVKFDFLLKTYYGNKSYINEFDLNSRTDNLFLDVIKSTYSTIFSNYNNLEEHIKMFSKNTLDDEFIRWINVHGILKNGDSSKLDNLIETMVLLEEL